VCGVCGCVCFGNEGSDLLGLHCKMQCAAGRL